MRALVATLVLLAWMPPFARAQETDPNATVPVLYGHGARWAIERPSGDTLRVMTWNIEHGANDFDEGPEKALAVIRDLDPDVCLLQESYDIEGERPTLGRWLAEQTGLHAYQGESPHLCILTRFEIVETMMHEPWHLVGATLRDDQGREFNACSIWIDYRAYTPYALRDDPMISDDDLLRCESEGSGRLNETRSILAFLKERGWLDAERPLLVGGDWNCPSHLDWTEHTQLVFRFRRDLPLPVSGAMRDAGFDDTYRVVHPDPVREPGVTWSPLYLGTPEKPETADRIDRIYLRQGGAPALRAVGATVLPRVHEDASIPEAQRVFPSDHAAVVVDFVWAGERE